MHILYCFPETNGFSSIIFSYPYFLKDTFETRLTQDLNQIGKEINPELAIVTNGGAYSFTALPTSYWSKPGTRYIWSRDLELFLANKTAYRNVQISSKSRFITDKTIIISVSTHHSSLITKDLLANSPYFILHKDEFRYRPDLKILTILWRGELDIQQVNLVKCYQELCVFRKVG